MQKCVWEKINPLWEDRKLGWVEEHVGFWRISWHTWEFPCNSRSCGNIMMFYMVRGSITVHWWFSLCTKRKQCEKGLCCTPLKLIYPNLLYWILVHVGMGGGRAWETENSPWEAGSGGSTWVSIFFFINIPPKSHCERNNRYFDLYMQFIVWCCMAVFILCRKKTTP